MLIWLTMVTGFRRGELCAIRWRHLDLAAGVLMLERSIGQRSGRTWEKDTKTHQHRRIALDPETLSLLSEHRHRCEARASAPGLALTDDAFVFSLAVFIGRKLQGLRDHLAPLLGNSQVRQLNQQIMIIPGNSIM